MERFWIWLATRNKVSDMQKLALLERFGDPEGIYRASPQEPAQLEGLREEALQELGDKELAGAEKILQTCEKKNIRLLTLAEEDYPARLKAIADPPVLLYCKGQLPELANAPAIGVVGTRKASTYGRNIAYRMGWQISRCGGVVVSGMASGIDGEATLGALASGKPAVGVLGCGVDRIFPQENLPLFRQMEEEGCLLSEFPPGTPGYKWNFPKRNRIISGMSCGVLVVEAPVKSGALITARQALDQGRDVFVVPGNIDVASCEGSNALLRDGAIMAGTGWDVVSEYAHLYPDTVVRELTPVRRERSVLQVAQPVKKPSSFAFDDKKDVDNLSRPPYSDRDGAASVLTDPERILLDGLDDREQHIDELIDRTGVPTGTAMAALTMLKIKDYVTLLPGGRIVKN